MMYLVLHLSPITRAVQIDPVTRPTRRTDRIRLESGRLDCFGGSTAGLHYQKPIPADRFRFSSPKTWKTRINRNISRLRPKCPFSGDSFPESGEETQIPVMFLLDPVRFWMDLAISHQIRWYFRQNLTRSGEISMYLKEISSKIGKLLPESGFLCRICVFFTVFLDLWLRPTRPPPIGGLNHPTRLLRRVGGRCIFFPPDFVGSVPGWAQTRLGPTRGQLYL